MSDTIIDRLERQGLDALVRAGERGAWFDGHFGAAAIAGARLLRDPNLPGDAALALTRLLDDFVVAQAQWFEPLSLEREPMAALEPILETLRSGAARLRSSGHPTIYLSAGVWALEHHPDLATQRSVRALCDLFASGEADDPQRYYGYDDYFEVVENHVPREGDESLDATAGRAFRSLEHIAHDREIDGHYYYLLGDKIHLFTHAHAAFTFHELGYADIAAETARAHVLHRQLLEPSHAIPESEGGEAPATPWEVAFWEKPIPDIFHQIKLAEAIVALWPRLPDAQQHAAAPRLRRMWFGMGA